MRRQVVPLPADDRHGQSLQPFPPIADDADNLAAGALHQLGAGNAVRVEVDVRQDSPFLVDIQLSTNASLAELPAADVVVTVGESLAAASSPMKFR